MCGRRDRRGRGEVPATGPEKGCQVTDAAATEPIRPSRLDRRKARTRQALVDAAVRLIADGRGDRASIQEITEAADIGFGSFYNHFESKQDLFDAAVDEAIEEHGAMLGELTRDLEDPAEVFAV